MTQFYTFIKVVNLIDQNFKILLGVLKLPNLVNQENKILNLLNIL